GSRWASPPGNLYATLLLTEPSVTAVAPQLSFVAVLAVHDAVATCAPDLSPVLKVKWPNDLLIGHAKVSGILIEGESKPVFTVAVGIGVNCVAHPPDTAFPATNLGAAGLAVAPEALLTGLAAAMQRRLAQWSRGQGFAPIRSDWLERAVGL